MSRNKLVTITLAAISAQVWITRPLTAGTVRDPGEIILEASFPKELLIKNLGDWQAYEADIVFHATCRLLQFRGELPNPELATQWSVSPDMKIFTFRLRQDAAFSDGTPITAKIVAFNLKRSLLHGQFSSLYLNNLAGSSLLRTPADEFPGVATPDEHTVIVTFKNPVATFLRHLDMLSFSIFHPNDVSPTEDRVKQNFRSSGVYQISRLDRDQVSLVLNKRHWKASTAGLFPKIKIIPSSAVSEMSRMVAGEIDSIRTSTAAKSYPEFIKRFLPILVTGPNLIFLSVNFASPALKEYPQLARDMNVALDRERLTAFIKAGGGANFQACSAVTANIKSLAEIESKRWTPADHAEALWRLKTAYPKVSNGSYPIVLVSIHNKSVELAIEGIKQQLTEAGLSVTSEIRELNEFIANKRPGSFAAALVSHDIDAQTPSGALQFLANSEPSYSNLPPEHELFTFYKKLAAVRTYEDHLKLVHEYNDLNARTGFIIPLFSSNGIIVFDKRIDISNVPPGETNWRVDDLRMK